MEDVESRGEDMILVPSHFSGSLECWYSWICGVITSCFLSAFGGVCTL